MVKDSCYYDAADTPFPNPDQTDEGGFFLRINRDPGAIAAYFESMDGYLTDKGVKFTLDDEGYQADLDSDDDGTFDVAVGAGYLDEVTEEMAGEEGFGAYGLKVGDSVMFGSISRFQS